MSSAQSVLRSLIVYSLCLPLAIFLGYSLTDPMTRSTFVIVTIVLAVLCAPLLIRYHQPMMLATWNSTAVLFFLPGHPQLWMVTILLSFMISSTHRILNKEIQAISVPGVTRPLIFLVLVIVITAELRGGIGMRAFGGEVYGGKRYILLLLSVLAYFALASYRIPRERARLSVALFFLGGLTCVVADLFPILGTSVPWLFWIIPPFSLDSEVQFGSTRFNGMAAGGSAIFFYMMARYGIRGIFISGKPWRLGAFILFSGLSLYGGFRSQLIGFIVLFIVQFFLEGLHRTKFLPVMALGVALIGASLVPFASHLPRTLQRSLAFLPISIDPVVRLDTEGSSDWRLRMWKSVLPQVPQYLLLGKGLALTPQDFDYSVQFGSSSLTENQWGAALAGDYHNGPLSVVIPFGIWGVIAFVWFTAAGFRVVYNNFRYGDPELRVVNTFLLAIYIVRTLMFWTIVGGFTSDFFLYVGYLGLSVGLNGGVARRVSVTPIAEAPVKDLAHALPRHRPAFGR